MPSPSIKPTGEQAHFLSDHSNVSLSQITTILRVFWCISTRTPQRHSLIDDYRDWPYSSYGVFIEEQAAFVKSDVVREWFGDVDELLDAHQAILDVDNVKDFVGDD